MSDTKKKDPLTSLMYGLLGAIFALVLLGVLLQMLMAAIPVVVMLAVIGLVSWLFVRERRKHAEYRRTHP